MRITRRALLSHLSACGTLSLLAQSQTSKAALKIRRVDPYLIRIGWRSDIVCVRIETEDGIHGWGEGTTPPNVRPVIAQIESFRPLLTGASAWDIERLWRRMYILEENTLGGTLYA